MRTPPKGCAWWAPVFIWLDGGLYRLVTLVVIFVMYLRSSNHTPVESELPRSTRPSSRLPRRQGGQLTPTNPYEGGHFDMIPWSDLQNPHYVRRSNAERLPQLLRVASAEFQGVMWSPQRTLVDNMAAILRDIYSLLYESARGGFMTTPFQSVLMERHTFNHTLTHPACMLLDSSKVTQSTFMRKVAQPKHKRCQFQSRSWYLRVKLGVVNGSQVWEYAHRLVLWAMCGPPPPEINFPVAMHICHNACCLNPLHLVWGEHRENVNKNTIEQDIATAQRVANQWSRLHIDVTT